MDRTVDVVVEPAQEAVMRDGVVLRGDVYHPADAGKYPVLLCRTPYDMRWQRFVDASRAMAARGYTVVMQDVRGRFTSDGEFRWQFRDRTETPEAEDGHDAVEWAARLPWSTGEVGLWGHSYDGWCAWMAAGTGPPSLKAMAATGISRNVLDMNHGIFETGRRLQWSHKIAADMRRRAGRTDGPVLPDDAVAEWANVDRGKHVWWLPLGDIPPAVFGELDDQLKTYMRNQNVEFWRLDELYPQVQVPVLMITGWWDRLIGTVDNYTGMVGDGPADLATRHRLIIGPWGHDVTAFPERIGPLDHGPDAYRHYPDMLVRWFDATIKGTDNGVADEDPVQLFIIGENRWRGVTSWPPGPSTTVEYRLASGGSANTVDGDGSLVPDTPDGAVSDSFRYDPKDPVMSLMAPDSQAAPVDQRSHDHRSDILVYDTAPLTETLEVIGAPVVRLWAASDAPDTDWTVKLAVVDANGRAVNLTYGIIRARYRNGYEKPALLEPGRPHEYEIHLNPIGCRLHPGERIRLYVSSSDFPNFDRNHNTGRDFWSDDELGVAHQTVFHSPEMPSTLRLPTTP